MLPDRLNLGAAKGYCPWVQHDRLLKDQFKGRGNVEISRFKGLGEMPAVQLKETTMDPASRSLIRVTIPLAEGAQDARDADPKAAERTADLVEGLMGRKPEKRLAFIQSHAPDAGDLDV